MQLLFAVAKAMSDPRLIRFLPMPGWNAQQILETRLPSDSLPVETAVPETFPRHAATPVNHNTIIGRAARSALRPIGCIQKGRSRTWLDDHLWWVNVIEFQPSSWAKGTFLNVGACWLWQVKDYLSFDDGYRVESFAPAEDSETFKRDAEKIAARAADEVLRFRERFSTLHAVAEHLTTKEVQLGDLRGHYHAGVSCGLAGWSSESERRLRSAIAVEEPGADWAVSLKADCERLLQVVNDAPTFRRDVAKMVDQSRAALKLPQTADAFGNL